MNDDALADLKQFIAGLMAQQTTDLRSDMEELKGRVSSLEHSLAVVDKKVDDLSAFVAEALDVSNEASAKQLKNHERRITRLEQKVA